MWYNYYTIMRGGQAHFVKTEMQYDEKLKF